MLTKDRESEAFKVSEMFILNQFLWRNTKQNPEKNIICSAHQNILLHSSYVT